MRIPPTFGGNIMRRALAASAVIGAGLVAACQTDSPTSVAAPVAQPSAQTALPISTSTIVDAVVSGAQRRQAIPADITVSATIDSKGGWLAVDEAGGYLYVPPHAVAAPTTFTMTALAGGMVAYEFQPHGMTFDKPLRVFQRTTGTYGVKPGSMHGLTIGYFPDRASLDLVHNTAHVKELLSLDTKSINGAMTFSVRHFSGYMVSSGRSLDR